MNDRLIYNLQRILPDVWDSLKLDQNQILEAEFFIAGKDFIKYLKDNEIVLRGNYLLHLELRPFELPKEINDV